MDAVVLLSRLQFAVAVYFHFLFVPLTLGLSILVAIFETLYVRSGDEDYRRAAKFWGKLFLINFAIGVVTGITLEFQFGTNWSRYSAYVGDIFGSLLAIEATAAFFIESTFIGVWAFGWKRLSKKVHLLAAWLVAFATNLSAYWILTANAWMQHPVGYTIRNGRAELTDFLAVVTQKTAILKFLHTTHSAYILAGFFVMGISAWHLLRNNETGFFRKSFRVAAIWSLVFAVLVIVHGHVQGALVAEEQPTKLAAMESHWETKTNAPIYLLAVPDPANERNAVQILPVPGALSMLAYHDPSAEVKGLREWPPEERPPVWPTFVSFRLMVGLGFLFLLLSAWATWKRAAPEENPLLLKLLLWSIPLPYLAIELGWTLAEVGRQPWIVYGLMKTADAASPAISTGQVLTTVIGFTLVYTLLGIADFYLLFKYARKGPAAA